MWELPAETVRPLTSERDVNVLVDGRYVLKVSNPAEDPAVVDMENTAMAHAARVDPGRDSLTGLPGCLTGLPYRAALRGTRMVPAMDAKTDELRAAHDVLAEFYADRLAGVLERMPSERAVLGLFCESVLAAGLGTSVADVGCGTGRLEPYLAAQGLAPRGVDLSPEMIRVARRDYPGFGFDVADVRDLPFSDASLAGVVCWYSLMFLAPPDRPAAFGELARVVKPGGYLVTAFKAGDGQLRRAGRGTGLGVEFDIYWLAPPDMERQVTDAGFTTTFWGGRAAEGEEASPQGYLIARRS